MDNQRIYFITDDNGRIVDCIIGDESKRELTKKTKEFIEKDTEREWIKHRIVELPLEGKIHNGHINIITTIKLNNIPFRAIANNFYNLIEIIESYMNLDDEYRKFSYYTNFIKL